MAESDTLWATAREDLLVFLPDGRADATVRDHSLRVARTALQLAALPALAGRRLDRVALRAAALYHDAGWIVEFGEGRVEAHALLAEPTNDVQRELGAAWMEHRLAGRVAVASLATASAAIRECNLKETAQTEAQLVAEAENLDEIGPLMIWRLLRRYGSDPRGLEAVIETWHRQQEYRFWPARIKDCFRIHAVRQLAEQRLAQLEAFMYALARGQRGEDLAELLQELGVTIPAVPAP